MTSLWSIKGRIYELLELRRDTLAPLSFTPEQQDEKLAALTVIDNEIRNYVVNEIKTNPQTVHAFMLESRARQAAIELEMKRLDGLLAAEQGEYSRAEELVLETMNAIGEKKLPVMGTLRRQGNGGVQPVDVVQESLVPERFQRLTVTVNAAFWEDIVCRIGNMEDAFEGNLSISKPAPDKEAIRKALEAGEGVPGCRLLPRGEQLRVS